MYSITERRGNVYRVAVAEAVAVGELEWVIELIFTTYYVLTPPLKLQQHAGGGRRWGDGISILKLCSLKERGEEWLLLLLL